MLCIWLSSCHALLCFDDKNQVCISDYREPTRFWLLQVSLALPTVQNSWGPGWTYILFAGIGVVALVVLNAIVPETKGKTLEEIEADWDLDKRK